MFAVLDRITHSIFFYITIYSSSVYNLKPPTATADQKFVSIV